MQKGRKRRMLSGGSEEPGGKGKSWTRLWVNSVRLMELTMDGFKFRIGF